MRSQAETQAVSFFETVTQPAFLLGVNDARAGRQFDDRRAHPGEIWDYERGRLFWWWLRTTDTPWSRNPEALAKMLEDAVHDGTVI